MASDLLSRLVFSTVWRAKWDVQLGGQWLSYLKPSKLLKINDLRWLFYIEGSLTVFFAFVAIFILPDFPATSTWLSPLERRLAEKRLEEDVGVGDNDETEKAGHAQGLVMALTDWKVWWLALVLASMVVSLSFNAFFPTLSKTMGFNNTVTLLLCAPPWIFATICAFAVTR